MKLFDKDRIISKASLLHIQVNAIQNGTITKISKSIPSGEGDDSLFFVVVVVVVVGKGEGGGI